VLKRPVIAVTGSSGKTTTKEMIASILKRRWKIYKSAGNQNSRGNLIHHAKKINPSHRAIVLEYGMSAQGHLTRSCKIIQPNMAVITMIGTAHIGNLGGSLENLIRAKSEIILNMKQSGTLFLNADDVNSKRLKTAKFKGKIIKIGINNDADYQALDVRFTKQGMLFGVNLHSIYHEFFIPILGTHNVYNALFAIAVSDRLGFSPEEIGEGLKAYRRPVRRLRIYHPNSDVCLIDDTYNANPNSVKAAIDVLCKIGEENNIAVLGSMSELGRYSRIGHKEVGRYLADKNIAYLFTYGDGAKLIGQEAVSHGFPSEKVIHTMNRKALHQRLEKAINPGSTVLVKGSHNMMMNKTVTALKNKT
jgi:UDP-N-acetylmuramoyl-tripeptide--D-alanyl-D-alanine ligase